MRLKNFAVYHITNHDNVLEWHQMTDNRHFLVIIGPMVSFLNISYSLNV